MTDIIQNVGEDIARNAQETSAVWCNCGNVIGGAKLLAIRGRRKVRAAAAGGARWCAVCRWRMNFPYVGNGNFIRRRFPFPTSEIPLRRRTELETAA